MTSKCLSCNHKNVKTRYGYTTCNYSGSECRNFELYDPIKKTNYDRIVSKTPEELAEWLNAVLTSNVAPFATIRGANKRGKLLDWLKREVDT